MARLNCPLTSQVPQHHHMIRPSTGAERIGDLDQPLGGDARPQPQRLQEGAALGSPINFRLLRQEHAVNDSGHARDDSGAATDRRPQRAVAAPAPDDRLCA